MENFLVSAIFWKNIEQSNVEQYQRYQPAVYTVSDQRTKTVRKIKQREIAEKIAQKKQKIQEEKPTTLIFAPHPDDEVLCCSLAINDRIERGEKVKIIYVTNGDAKDDQDHIVSQKYGEVRIGEARQAARSLGLKNKDLIFLDYPDGYLALLDDFKVTTSRFTGQNKTNTQSFHPNTDYTWLNLKKDIKDIILKYQPKEIFIPNQYVDQHWDHREVGRVVEFILEEIPNPPKTSMYAIHRKKPLKKVELNKFKLNLIDIFKSQFHTDKHRKFLEDFAQVPEVFSLWKRKIFSRKL